MKVGLVDIGSNTVRLCVYERGEETIRLLYTQKVTAGLAGYVKKGALTAQGISRCIEVLGSLREMAAGFGLSGEDLHVFATASLRNVRNTDEAVEKVREATGLTVDVILGREEALFDYVGATAGVGVADALVADIGGGSIEFAARERDAVKAVSIDVGSLNLYTNHVSELFPNKEERRAIRAAVGGKIEALPEFRHCVYPSVCGVGGTVRAAGKLYNTLHGLAPENRIFPAAAVGEMLEPFKKPDKAALDLLLRVVPDRVHTFVPGMLALKVILDSFEAETVYVSAYGVREGYLYRKILKEETPHAKIVGL